MDTTDPDIQELNEKIGELTEMVKDTRRMTRSVYRSVRLNSFISIIKWIIIIAITVGSLYFLQPYINFLKNTYDTFGSAFGSKSAQTEQATTSPSFDWVSLIKKF